MENLEKKYTEKMWLNKYLVHKNKSLQGQKYVERNYIYIE